MIEALAPNGTNHPLHIGSLPRRTRRRQYFLDAKVSHLFSEVIAEDRIAVPQQVAREFGFEAFVETRNQRGVSSEKWASEERIMKEV